MPTGDLTNNLRKLQKEVKLIKYNEETNLAEMSLGKPTAFLPLYHYAFTSYNHALAELISASDAELFGKTDFRFIEAVYKILRDLFSYKPLITKEQFFNTGFAERKIIMCSEVLRLVREKSHALNPPKKSTTGGAAVSGLVQLVPTKGSRPKSADPVSTNAPVSTSGRAKRPKTMTNTKTVRVASPPASAPQVVNELLQPHRPQCHPVRHMTEHLQHPPLTTDVASPPHVTKERLATRTLNQQPSDVHFLPVSSVTRNRSVPVNSGPEEKHLEETAEDEEESEEDEIETVNAVTRGESFLEPQCVTDSPTHQPFVPSHESQQYNQTIQAVLDRMNNLDSVVKNITGLVESQAVLGPNDKVNATLTTMQQQLETLMARMVLVENRVALVEARLSGNRTVPGEPTMNQGMRDTRQYKSSYPEAPQGASQTVPGEPTMNQGMRGQYKAGYPEAPHGASQPVGYAGVYHGSTHTCSPAESHQQPNNVGLGKVSQSNMHCQSGTGSHKALNVLQSVGDSHDTHGGGPVNNGTHGGGPVNIDTHGGGPVNILGGQAFTPLQAQPADQQMQFLATNHSNGSSLFSDLAHCPQTNLTSRDINDSAAVGLSPIRKPVDLSINQSATLPPLDFTNDDTFAAVTQNEKRLSSTPTKHPLMLESLEDSLSFHFGDPTSQERFLRIKTMIKETENLLTKPTSTLTEGNS